MYLLVPFIVKFNLHCKPVVLLCTWNRCRSKFKVPSLNSMVTKDMWEPQCELLQMQMFYVNCNHSCWAVSRLRPSGLMDFRIPWC